MDGEICLNEDFEPPGNHASAEVQSAALKHLSHVNSHRVLPLFRGDNRTRIFRKKFFPNIQSEEWHDWRWQLRNRVTQLDELSRFIALSDEEAKSISCHSGSLPLGITPYYLSLIDPDDPGQPLRRTVIPVGTEFLKAEGEADDPLNEDDQSPVPGLVHRYPDRVLFLTTGFCSVYCRYCTRSRMVGTNEGHHFGMDQWEKALAYIESTETIRDVLLSGGDPLTLPEDRIEYLLSRLKKIPHVEFIRIGTKVPVTLPQRITLSLCRMLRKYHPVWMSIHFTHPAELTHEVHQACSRLADSGIPLGSQTVLLKGINDSMETMKKLVHGLLKMRVRPYYLYQCDPITGSSHFRTSVKKGIEIIQGLRGFTTGYAVPTYVIDAPGGGGKIPVSPDYAAGYEGNNLVLRNYQGNTYRYPDLC
jgi:lysine 2,3-aminomutase